MKFILQMIFNVAMSFMASITKTIAGYKHGQNDIYFFICGLLLLVSLFNQWVLILAFLALLPAFYDQLTIKHNEIGTVASEQLEPVESQRESETHLNSAQLVDEGFDNTNPESDSDDKMRTPKQKLKNKGKSKSTAPSERKRSAKEDWGIPTMRVKDQSGKLIPVNSEKPIPIESEYFKGFILIMVKCDGEHSAFNRYEEHFAGKQRKFEVQFQGQMKFLPKGDVMLGGELFDKMQMSFVTRSLLSFLMKFAMSLNPFLHFSFGDDHTKDGRFEFPHLTFPLFRVMDRVVVTAPGETPPELGRELPEETADRVARRSGKGPHMTFKQDHIYSFSFHSMYVDFPRWSICNFPGYKYIDLRGFIGQQTIKVVCYELVDPSKSEGENPNNGPSTLPHYNSFKQYLMSMELSHVSIMSTEELTTADEEVPYNEEESDEDGDNASDNSEAFDMERRETEERLSDVNDLVMDELNGVNDVLFRENDDDGDGRLGHSLQQHQQQDDDDENDLGSLGTGVEYVRANSVVSIISLPAPWEGNTDGSGTGEVDEGEICDECYFSDCHTSIGDVGGVAMRKECRDIPIVRFIRPTAAASTSQSSALRYPLKSLRRVVGGSTRSPPAGSNPDESEHPVLPIEDSRESYIRSGDAVTIQCASTGRFLTVHRGWWVSWTAEDTGSKCVFSINMMSSTGLSYAPDGSRLIAGKPFRLRSVRWPDWEIGCYDSRYAERVGQPVVLYQSRMNAKRTARDRPVIWGKNGKLVSPLVLCIMPEVNVSYVEADIDGKNSGAIARARAAFLNSPQLTKPNDEEGTANADMTFCNVKMMESDDSSLSYRFDMVIVGWAEVLNRRHNRPQLAYIIEASYGSGNNVKKWITLRTQEDLEAIIQDVPVEYGGGVLESFSTPVRRPPTRMTSFRGAVSGSGRVEESPQLTSQKHLETLRRKVAFRTISARHQCAADQSVHLMSLRIQDLMMRDPGNEDIKSELSPRDRDEVNSDGEISIVGDGSPPLSVSTHSKTDSPSNTPRNVFLRALNTIQLLDSWFIQDSDAEKYLVVPANRRAPKRKKVAIVARALWDTHWREELIVLYPSYIAFYPPLAKKASWTLYLQELIGISHIHDDASPLPGYSVLRIETIGRIHYVAFSSKETCNEMAGSILEQFSGITFDVSMPSFGDMTDPRDRFVLKSGRWRPSGRRLILNSRKFSFDLNSSGISEIKPFGPDSGESYWAFSARLLRTVFQLDSNNSIKITPETLKSTSEQKSNDDAIEGKVDVSFESDADGLFPGREKIISFLDDTVRLKLIDLQNDIDLNSPEALCFFINIYHTLLIHARLVLSPPSTQDWATFFENVSYEIGGDVFSLAELEHCVVSGKLNPPAAMPRNFCPPPPPTDDHYTYALHLADRRTRFIMNSCSLSNPPVVYVMRPENLYVHLNEASIALFEYCFSVDMKKRTVVLPKVCDTFKADFGNNVQEVLRHTLRYLGRDNWEKLSILLTGPKPPIVKFQDMKCRSHDSLQLIA